MTLATAAMLQDWFDIANPGLTVDGGTLEVHDVTRECLEAICKATDCPRPAFVGHHGDEAYSGKSMPQVAGLVKALRICPETGALQGRLVDMDWRFVRDCARGEFFVRSAAIRDGRMFALAFGGDDVVPGSWDNRSEHFMDALAFETHKEFAERKEFIEIPWRMWANDAREAVIDCAKVIQSYEGNFYFRTGTGSRAGEIYRKVAGAWVKQVDTWQAVAARLPADGSGLRYRAG